jgi:hypothetical protein
LERAKKYLQKKEYFDVLNQTRRCSKLLQVQEKDTVASVLKRLYSQNIVAFMILKDCYIFSAIAYI